MSSDYLAEVLQCAPCTWTHASYTSSNYVTVLLTKHSSEYEGIVSALRAKHTSLAVHISKIERVQHPFAYGRFVLRQEQLEKRTGTKRTQTRYFLQVKESELKKALEYNMDARRTPLDSSNRQTTADKCVVLVQSLGAPSSWKRDCECYPEYVVYYSGTLPSETTPSSSQYRRQHSDYYYEPDFGFENDGNDYEPEFDFDDHGNDYEPEFNFNDHEPEFIFDDHGNDCEPEFIFDDHGNDYEPEFDFDDHVNDHEPEFDFDDHGNDYEPYFDFDDPGNDYEPEFDFDNRGNDYKPEFDFDDHGNDYEPEFDFDDHGNDYEPEFDFDDHGNDYEPEFDFDDHGNDYEPDFGFDD